MASTKLRVRHGGPLVIEGDFEIFDAAGKRIDLRGASRIKLCRCGQTKQPPICDGTHYKTDFEASLKAPT